MHNELYQEKCPTPTGTEIIPPVDGNTTNAIKILIEMDNNGNYTIKEWVDPNKDYELDGLIFEIFKNE